MHGSNKTLLGLTSQPTTCRRPPVRAARGCEKFAWGSLSRWLLYAATVIGLALGIHTLMPTSGSGRHESSSEDGLLLPPNSAGEKRLAKATNERALQAIHGSDRRPLTSQVTLQGTDRWCISTHLQILPCTDLKKQFDRYLAGSRPGQPLDLARARLAEDATREIGPDLAREVFLIWDRYIELRAHPLTQKKLSGGREDWASHHEALWKLRRKVLGQEWADEFFSQEEFLDREWNSARMLRPPAEALDSDRTQRWPQHNASRSADPEFHHNQKQQLLQFDPLPDHRINLQAIASDPRFIEVMKDWSRIEQTSHFSSDQKRQEMMRVLEQRFKDALVRQ